MQPAYHGSKGESGKGLKVRMLNRLQPAAIEAARPIYTTIQADLLEGLNELEIVMSGMFQELAKAAEEQAKIVAHNANIEVNEAATDPLLISLLNPIPSMSIATKPISVLLAEGIVRFHRISFYGGDFRNPWCDQCE